MELVDGLTAFMVYSCAVRGEKEGIIRGKLQAVKFLSRATNGPLAAVELVQGGGR